VAELKAAPGRIGHPLFWAGQRPDTQLELSLGDDGAGYVRYLPLGTPAGSPKSDFTLVATYQDQDAYSRLQSGAKRASAVSVKGANGALMMAASMTATNAYFAFPDVPLLVEVYDPSPGEAYRLIQSGLVQLVR
jgi:hypothetical protein